MASSKFNRKSIVSGNFNVNGVAWADLNNLLDLTLSDVRASDIIEVNLSALFGPEATEAYLDVVAIVAGVAKNPWSEVLAGGTVEDATHKGFQSWLAASGVATSIGGSIFKQVSAADLNSNGTLQIRFRVRTLAATNKVVNATAVNPITAMVINHGQ